MDDDVRVHSNDVSSFWECLNSISKLENMTSEDILLYKINCLVMKDKRRPQKTISKKGAYKKRKKNQII